MDIEKNTAKTYFYEFSGILKETFKSLQMELKTFSISLFGKFYIL